MYTLVGTPRTRSFRVLWFLHELGVPFTHVPAPPQSELALAHNPAGKVPALIEGAATITDSTAILTYLADKHGQFTAPAGTMARAQQDSMTQFLLDECDAILWTAARHSFVLPQEMRLPAIKASLRWEYARSLRRLSSRFLGPYVMGEVFSVPDIIATHCLGWGVSAGFAAPEGALAAYFDAMRARPAYIAAQS